MLDGTEYFECACGGDEHTLRFIIDKEDKRLYTSVFLNDYQSIWKRVWIAIKYIFGYKCQYGHWDYWIMRYEDIPRMREMLDKMDGADPTKEKS